MKTIRSFALVSALGVALSSAGAVASSDANLSLSATVIPAACTLTLSNGGNFDFGDTNASQINRNAMTLLETEVTQLRVSCDQPAPVALLLTGLDVASQVVLPIPTYVGMPSPSTEFQGGLGYKNGSKIGSFQAEVKYNSFTDNGTTILTIASPKDSLSWNLTSVMLLGTGRLISFGTRYQPLPVTDLVGEMQVRVGIAHDQGLTFEDSIEFESNVALELVYL